MTSLGSLLDEVCGCRACADMLPLGLHPILQLSPSARILIAS
jgi:hypothetical protein